MFHIFIVLAICPPFTSRIIRSGKLPDLFFFEPFFVCFSCFFVLGMFFPFASGIVLGDCHKQFFLEYFLGFFSCFFPCGYLSPFYLSNCPGEMPKGVFFDSFFLVFLFFSFWLFFPFVFRIVLRGLSKAVVSRTLFDFFHFFFHLVICPAFTSRIVPENCQKEFSLEPFFVFFTVFFVLKGRGR